MISANFISNTHWRHVFYDLHWSKDDYSEKIGANYFFDPVTDHIMSNNSTLFDIKKAAAMYFWYKSGNRSDHSIIKYFEEYKKCVDEWHPMFNSNYGYYAYTLGGLNNCVAKLLKDKNTRQACFCINNNEAMGFSSIDKLCTNVIHFFIRDKLLEMVVQMRSSNFITLLPYDAFMFSVFYMQVYKYLKREYKWLGTGLIHMQVATLHLYKHDIEAIKLIEPNILPKIIDFDAKDCQEQLENYLMKILHKTYQPMV